MRQARKRVRFSPHSCQDSWLGDGACDMTCNTTRCLYDGGDCINATIALKSAASSSSYSGKGSRYSTHTDSASAPATPPPPEEPPCAPGCPSSWLGDLMCDSKCDFPEWCVFCAVTARCWGSLTCDLPLQRLGRRRLRGAQGVWQHSRGCGKQQPRSVVFVDSAYDCSLF